MNESWRHPIGFYANFGSQQHLCVETLSNQTYGNVDRKEP